MSARMSDEELEATLVQYLQAEAEKESQRPPAEGGGYVTNELFEATAQAMIAAERNQHGAAGIRTLKRQMRQWLEAQS